VLLTIRSSPLPAHRLQWGMGSFLKIAFASAAIATGQICATYCWYGASGGSSPFLFPFIASVGLCGVAAYLSLPKQWLPLNRWLLARLDSRKRCHAEANRDGPIWLSTALDRDSTSARDYLGRILIFWATVII
jgi:hypothetical protein